METRCWHDIPTIRAIQPTYWELYMETQLQVETRLRRQDSPQNQRDRKLRRDWMGGRVEDWRVSGRVRWQFRRFRAGPQSGSHGHVSSPRSSNRTCPTKASGLQTRSCLRPRKALGLRRKVDQAEVMPQPLVGEPHVFSGLHLVFPTEPPSQPPGRVLVHGLVGRADLAEDVVVRPAGRKPASRSAA